MSVMPGEGLAADQQEFTVGRNGIVIPNTDRYLSTADKAYRDQPGIRYFLSHLLGLNQPRGKVHQDEQLLVVPPSAEKALVLVQQRDRQIDGDRTTDSQGVTSRLVGSTTIRVLGLPRDSVTPVEVLTFYDENWWQDVVNTYPRRPKGAWGSSCYQAGEISGPDVVSLGDDPDDRRWFGSYSPADELDQLVLDLAEHLR